MTMCGYIAAEFEIIQKDLINLIDDQNFPKLAANQIYSKEQNQKIFRMLSKIIARHSQLIQLNRRVSELFAPNITIHFLTSALHMGLISVSLMMATNELETFKSIFYIFIDLAQLFIFCYGGTLVIESVSI